MSETNQQRTFTANQRRRYPSLSLEQAVERLGILYSRERLNVTPVDVIVQHWGFKSISTGPASTAYSAVKQFGLLDESGQGTQRKASISERGRTILTAPHDVQVEELRAAALEPTMNRLIWERYGTHTGSPESFRWYLVKELGFSDTGAKEFAKQYQATVAFAGLEDSPPAPETDTEDVNDREPASVSDGYLQNEAVARRNQAVHSVAPTVDVWNTPDGRHEVPVLHPPTTTRTSRHAIPLVGGKQVILEGEFPLNEAAWQGFLAVLQAFKPGLVEAQSSEDSEPSTRQGSSSGAEEAEPVWETRS